MSTGAYQIYTGKWHNYSDSSGSQLTLTVFYGTLLVAAAATFVAIVGGQVWLTATFVTHQIRAARGPQDAMYHLHQATLRNSGTPLGAIWSFYKSAFVYCGRQSWWKFWKRLAARYVERPKSRTFSSISIALVVWLTFTTAGLLLSFLTHKPYEGNEVKVKSMECGIEQWSTDASGNDAFKRYNIRTARDALAYVNACYNTTTSTACMTLPRQELPYDVVAGMSCPFGQFCKTPAIEMTTHWLSSHQDFGINAPSQNRLLWRKQATCAVIDASSVTKTVPFGNGLSSHQYYLGAVAGISTFTAYGIERQPYDYAGYSVSSVYAFAGVPNQPWTPIADLAIPDGDMSLFAVQFGAITYDTAVADPLYSANNLTSWGNYASDDVAGLVACIDRYQLKSPDGLITTDLAGVNQVTIQYQTLPFNKAQLATATRLMLPGYFSEMYNAVSGLGTAALRAQRAVLDKISIGLPDDQWQSEVRGWFETTLAMYQQKIVAYAYKPGIRNEGSVTLRHNFTLSNGFDLTEEMTNMCDEQKIRNVATHQTFSLTGLIIVAAVGGVLILLSLLQEGLWAGMWKFYMWIRSFFSASRYGQVSNWRLREWQLASVPQMQRLIFQNARQGDWERSQDDIPVVRGELEMHEWDEEKEAYQPISY